MIYMDNAATKSANFGPFNANSIYADKEREQLQNAREKIAHIIHANPEEIYFTSGGCESNSWALQRIDTEKKHIITTSCEHSSVMNCCKWLEKHSKYVTYLEPHFELRELGYAIVGETFLVSVMHINNEVGYENDIEAIGEYIYKQNQSRKEMCELRKMPYEPIYFHVDAVQSMGKLDIDVEKCHIDLLSASGHKFGVDTGVGFLYCRNGVPLEPLIFGGSQERGIRGGTTNLNAIISMANSLSTNGIDKRKHDLVLDLGQYLTEELNKIEHDKIINSPLNTQTGIVSCSFKDVDAEALMVFLNDMNVYVSAGSACNTDHKEPSHVLQALNIPEEYINGTIRFSVSEFNTKAQVDKVIHLISGYLKLNGV